MWFVHLVATLFTAAIIVALAAYFDRPAAKSATEAVDRLMLGTADLLARVMHDPAGAALYTLAAFVGMEALFVLVATTLMPAGARDEPLRISFGHALRQTWLGTARIGALVLLVGGLAVTWSQLERNWAGIDPPVYPHHPAPPMRSDFDSDVAFQDAVDLYEKQTAAFDGEVDAYFQAYAAYQKELDKLGPKPWYLQQWGGLIIALSFLCGLWHLLAWVRAIAALRPVPRVDRPPLCEFCGYNLTSAELDARCPECGTAVAASIGPDVRCGPDWERRSGFWTPWWATAREAVSNPTEFGRALRVSTAADDARRFQAVAFPCFVIIGATAMFLFFLSADLPGHLLDNLYIVVPVVTIFGCSCAIGALGVTLLAALVVGLWHGRSVGRNLLSPAYQSACYLTCSLIAWQVFGAVLGFVTNYLGEAGLFGALRDLTSFNEAALAAWFFLVPNFTCLMLFLRQVSRITAACRYANR